MGRVASSDVERNIGGSGACQGAPHEERKRKDMTQFEMFVTEGNEKEDDLSKAGARLDE